ncbi:hypothetical protein [Jatrophihabitans sp.]|uniref:hypothetical protein n=1 Tax=Jatrophihabitans sp. TaxID=1932789 RepID=UPI0030C725DC|nr:hypothetical protein [Jatrophihabitans sp.]
MMWSHGSHSSGAWMAICLVTVVLLLVIAVAIVLMAQAASRTAQRAGRAEDETAGPGAGTPPAQP